MVGPSPSNSSVDCVVDVVDVDVVDVVNVDVVDVVDFVDFVNVVNVVDVDVVDVDVVDVDGGTFSDAVESIKSGSDPDDESEFIVSNSLGTSGNSIIVEHAIDVTVDEVGIKVVPPSPLASLDDEVTSDSVSGLVA